MSAKYSLKLHPAFDVGCSMLDVRRSYSRLTTMLCLGTLLTLTAAALGRDEIPLQSHSQSRSEIVSTDGRIDA